MKTIAVHQFHSGSAYGDAVTNSMILIRRMLCRAGFVSEIYVEHVAPELDELLHHYKSLKLRDDDVLLIHHSMGHDQIDWIMGLPGKKNLIYHNITPVDFFPEDSVFRHYSRLGREMLNTYRPVMDKAIAVSTINAHELAGCGYDDVKEIPLLIDVDTIQDLAWDADIVSASSGVYTILFVGRVAPNKCQTDLITIAQHLKSMIKRPFQLVLVGGYYEGEPYYQELAGQIASAGLTDCVRFTGKIPEAELYGWYRAADVFLCMSEHEGFGVPLIEAMAFDVPVIAFKSSNVPHTMGGTGILVTQKDHGAIAALIKILSEDRAMKRAIIKEQRIHVCNFTEEQISLKLYECLKEQGIDIPHPVSFEPCNNINRLKYQVEGPFESSYSLAQVNRSLAFALNKRTPDSVGLFATEGGGDYEPDMDAIASIPGLKAIWEKGGKAGRADVVIRNLYPPRVPDMDGQINLMNYAWEESGFPDRWTRDFNRSLDGLTVTSSFVKKTMQDNGVCLPIATIGNGVNPFFAVNGQGGRRKKSKGFRFLHISSCFPRKGADLLLRAFAETFTSKDKVRLVIKTFPNIHNTIESQVKALKKRFPECPPIEIINKDFTDKEIADLYKKCDALVAPSRGEGFGLPMAEAMFHGLPVITTAYGGQSDFCTEQTSWLIDFTFQPAQTHMDLFDSVWIEPEVDHLGKLMHEVRYATHDELQPRIAAARKLIETEFTWDRAADRLKSLEQQILRIKPLSRKKYRLGWVSSWNSKCGIATYSRLLVDALDKDDFETRILGSTSDVVVTPDESNVIRCWTDQSGDVDRLLDQLPDLDVLVIQFNFGFYSIQDLERIIRFTSDHGIVSIIFFHATKDVDKPDFKASLGSICDTLSKADRLLVHGLEDLNRFKSWGLYENVSIFPHGVLNRPKGTSTSSSLVIASYGFMLPHKGLEQLIQGFAILRKQYPDLRLLMVNALYPAPVSDETRARCQDLIQDNSLQDSVTMVNDFLDDEDSFALLDSANMVVFPYQGTAESSSAAVRWGLATHKPVVCTPLNIFSDVKEVVHTLPGTSPEEIAQGVEELIQSPDLLNSKQEIQDKWLAAHSWDLLGERLGGMVKGLCVDKDFKG